MTGNVAQTSVSPAATTASPAVIHPTVRRADGSTAPAAPSTVAPRANTPSHWPTLSVVVPVYNEASTLRTLVGRVLASEFVTEVLLVDDGSSDGSSSILAELESPPRVRVLRHVSNLGKGAALRTGFAHATADVVVVQDADLEYDPADYPRLLRPFVDARADAVYGSRFLGRDGVRVPLIHHWIGNRVLTWWSNRFTGLGLSDMETCYKAIRRDVLQRLTLRENRFTIEPEITAKLSRVPDARIFEVPINYQGRRHAEGKKIGWRDGFAALWAVVKYRFRD